MPPSAPPSASGSRTRRPSHSSSAHTTAGGVNGRLGEPSGFSISSRNGRDGRGKRGGSFKGERRKGLASGIIQIMLDRVSPRMGGSSTSPSSSFSADPKSQWALDKLVKLGRTNLVEVVETLVIYLQDIGRISPRDDDPHTTACTLLLLSVLLAVLPKLPANSSSPPSPPLNLDDATTLLLLELLTSLYTSRDSSSPISRPSEDSSRGSSSIKQGLYRHHQPSSRQNHASSSSRSGPFSPASSSSSLPGPDGLNSNPNAASASSFSNQPPTAGNFSSIPDSTKRIKEGAAAVIKVVSYHRWDLMWPKIRNKIRRLASETTDADQLSEIVLIGACFADRSRVAQILHELSPVMLHLPRQAQSTIAVALYPALLSFLEFCPNDFVELYRTNTRLEGDLSSMFDICYGIVGDSNTLTTKKAGDFWPFMSMLLAFCPDLVSKLVDADVKEGRAAVPGSMVKKVAFIETLQTSIYSNKHGNAARQAALDLLHLASLLSPTIPHSSLDGLVFELATDLQDQLLNGKDILNVPLISKGVAIMYRRHPESFVTNNLSKLNGSQFQMTCLVRGLGRVVKESSSPHDLSSLYPSVGPSLASFLYSLKDPSSSTELLSIRELTPNAAELASAILDLHALDFRFLVYSSSLSGDDIVSILEIISAMLVRPSPPSVRAAAAGSIMSMHEQIAELPAGDEAARAVIKAFGVSGWRSVEYASRCVLINGTDRLNGVGVLRALGQSVVHLNARHPSSLPSSTVMEDAFAADEFATSSVFLYPDPLVIENLTDLTRASLKSLASLLQAISISGFGRGEVEAALEKRRDRWLHYFSLMDTHLAETPDLPFRPSIHDGQFVVRRKHIFVLNNLYSFWKSIDVDIGRGLITESSSEWEEWRSIGSFLCRVGGACEGLDAWKGEEDDPSLVFLAAFLQDLTVHLADPEPSVRLAVQEDLSRVDARMLPTLVAVALNTSESFLTSDKTPDLSDHHDWYIHHILLTFETLVTTIEQAIEVDLGELVLNILTYLESLVSTIPSLLASGSTSTPRIASCFETLKRFCALAGAMIRKQDMLSWRSFRSWRNVILDTIAAWTTAGFIEYDDSEISVLHDELDLAIFSAAIFIAERLVLRSDYRLGGSRKRLFTRWLDVSKTTLARDQISSALKAAVIETLSVLLKANLDIGLDSFLEISFSSDANTRAWSLQVLGSVLRANEKIKLYDHDGGDAKRLPLLETLLEADFPLLETLWKDRNSAEHDMLAELVLRQFEAKGDPLKLLEILVEIEVTQTNDAIQILRGNTLTTKVFTLFAKRHSQNYIRDLLQPFITGIIEDHPASRYDLNRTSNPRGADPAATRSVEIFAQTLLDRLCHESFPAPPLLQAACRLLADMVARKFPSRGRQAVGSFIILRLISPSIVAPEAANLNIGGLNSSGRRTLVDISKLITNLANESTEYALFRSSENVARMVALLDSLQAAPAPNAPPVQLVCTSQPDDSFDELYLTHVCTLNAETVKTALSLHPKIEVIRQSLQGRLDRTGLTNSRSNSSLPFEYTRRRLRYEGFMRRQTAARLAWFSDVFKNVSVEGKTIYLLDCSGLELVDLDLLLCHVLQVLEDSTVSFDLVIDCKHLYTALDPPIGWLIEALKTIPEEISSRARKILIFCPNQHSMAIFRRFSALLGIMGASQMLKEVSTPSNVHALASLLEVDVSIAALITNFPGDDLPDFADELFLVDAVGQRMPATVLVGSGLVQVRHTTNLGKASASVSSVALKEIYRLSDIDDLVTSTSSQGYRSLKISFYQGNHLHLESTDTLELEKSLCSNMTRVGRSPILTPEGFAAKVTITGLLNLSAASDAVRSEAYDLLRNVHLREIASIPPSLDVAGLNIPATSFSLLNEFSQQIALNNSPKRTLAFLKECCLAFELPLSTTEEHFLLEHLIDWLRILPSYLASTKSLEEGVEMELMKDLIASSLASSQPLHPSRLAVWTQIAKVERLREPVVHELISRAAYQGGEACEMIAEILTTIASPIVQGMAIATARQLFEGRSSSLNLRDHSAWKQISALITINSKLSWPSPNRQPSFVEIYLPELLHISTMSLATTDDTEILRIARMLNNTAYSLASPVPDEALRLAEALQKLRTLPSLAKGDQATYAELLSRADAIAAVVRGMFELMSAVAVNFDQRNIWRARWISLATAASLGPNAAVRSVSLLALDILLCEGLPELFVPLLGLICKTLTTHLDDRWTLMSAVRLIATGVAFLSNESVTSCFWIGVAIAQIGPFHFDVATDLIAHSLRTLAARSCFPTADDFIEVLQTQSGGLVNISKDWQVDFESSFAFSMLILLFQGNRSDPITTAEIFGDLLRILLQSKLLHPPEELALLTAISRLDPSIGLEGIYERDLKKGEPWDTLGLPETKDTTTLLAFLTCVLKTCGTEGQKRTSFRLLARAGREAPSILESASHLVLPEIERLIANCQDDYLSALIDIILPGIISAPLHDSMMDRARMVLERRGLSNILTCDDPPKPSQESFRRLSFIASELCRGEIQRSSAF